MMSMMSMMMIIMIMIMVVTMMEVMSARSKLLYKDRDLGNFHSKAEACSYF